MKKKTKTKRKKRTEAFFVQQARVKALRERKRRCSKVVKAIFKTVKTMNERELAILEDVTQRAYGRACL